MFIEKIILLSILLNYINFNVCTSEKVNVKNTSQMFMQKFRPHQCKNVKRDFDQLKGDWYYVARITNPHAPAARCGNLTVYETSRSGFTSELTFITTESERKSVSIHGEYVNDVAVMIPELPNLIWGILDWTIYPLDVDVIICNNDVFFLEPIYYTGGTMVFARQIPADMKSFLNIFETPLEKNGTVLRKRVRRNCLDV